MRTWQQFVLDLTIFITVIGLILYVYVTYGSQILHFLYGEQPETVFLADVALQVTYADDPAERQLGLSGTASLKETQGKLFFFDTPDYYGMWMKDMNYPIDILWINNDLTVVHIEKNVQPDSYPNTYYPSAPARFVLELNAFFTDQYNIKVGDRLSIPAADLPEDLQPI